MPSTHWNFLAALDALHQKIQDTLTDGLLVSQQSRIWIGNNSETTWISGIEMHETETEIVLKILMAPVSFIDLDVQVSSETALIQGRLDTDAVEGFFAPVRVQHLIPLPIPVHPEAVRAHWKANQLTLTLPKTSRVHRQRIVVEMSEPGCPVQAKFSQVEPC